MNPIFRGHSLRLRAKRAGVPPKQPVKVQAASPALLFEQTGSSSLDVDAACASELLHGFNLRAGNIHIIAAIHNALGQQQICVLSHIGAGNPALIQCTQHLLGSDYSSVNIGETFMHKQFLPFIVLCAYRPRGRLAQQT